jgi:hypothetical protein
MVNCFYDNIVQLYCVLIYEPMYYLPLFSPFLLLISFASNTIFYFTDDSTTYWIAASGSPGSPGLHQLIEEIRLLELELDCSQQVIQHIPGLIMINQGSDGLSRGIWMSVLQGLEDSRCLTQAVFKPLCFDPSLAES